MSYVQHSTQIALYSVQVIILDVANEEVKSKQCVYTDIAVC